MVFGYVLFILGSIAEFSIMIKQIRLKDALKLMNERDVRGALKPFTIKVRTFNVRNKMGGRLVTFKKATLIPLANQKRYESDNDIKSDPIHFENRTRNIQLDNGEIKKIHIDFIIEFNNKTVLY